MDENENNSNSPKKDIIATIKPESIKMDILYFKNDLLKEIKQLEKDLLQKSKETNDALKDKISVYEIKMNFIKEQISSLSKKILDRNKTEEEISNINKISQRLLNESTTDKIKLNLLEKETRRSIDQINELLKKSIIYPGVIGSKAKFNTFHEFIDFLIAESNYNNNFRQKNNMDLSSFKLKVDKNINLLTFKIESNLVSSNGYTDRKVKEVLGKFDDILLKYKQNLNELRIENSDYVIQLEKDTKDLRRETNLIKNMRNQIFDKIDNEVNYIKTENEKIVENFKGFKEDIDIMKNDIIKIEKKIENLIIEKIGTLFDEQKKANENHDNFKKNYDENKNAIESKLNEIKEENNSINNFIHELNEKFNMISNYLVRNNKLNNQISDTDNNINKLMNNFESINNNNLNSVFSRDNRTNYTSIRSKHINSNNNVFTNRNMNNNIKIKNIVYNNNHRESIINLNKLSYIPNTENEKDFLNNNNNCVSPNNHNHISNQEQSIFNKKILDNLKINKIKKVAKISNHDNGNNNNINININNKYERNKNMNKKVSLNIRNKNVLKAQDKSKTIKLDEDKEKDKDIDYDDKIIKSKKSKIIKRRSFNDEKVKALEKFQKLLKININDVNAKLNEGTNTSNMSFKILNENKEIYDRFQFLNSNETKEGLNYKYINTKNSLSNNHHSNKINLLNIYNNGNQSDKNSNEDYSSTKNMIEAKTSSYFYHVEPMKKTKKKELNKRPDSQNILKFGRNNKLNLVKKTNSEIMNLKSDSKGEKMGTNSLSRLNNYFIKFLENETDDIKKKKKKNKKALKYKSLGNNIKITDEIKETINHKNNNNNNNNNNIRQIKGIFENKNK